MGLLGPKKTSYAVGECTEAIIIARLLEVGYGVLTPFGGNRRYDLVIEDADGNFYRIQCKTGKLEMEGSVITFLTSSTDYRVTAKGSVFGRKDYRGQIDYFAIYCPETRGTYLVPVDHVGKVEGYLRLLPTKNKQGRNVRWAKDYEL